MRIGVVGPIWENIPPKGYGGTELVVYNLVEGLVNLGHDVTLFGPGTSKISGKLIATVDKPLRDQNVDWKNISYNILHLTAAFEKQDQFDIFHVHLNKSQDFIAFPLATASNTPVVFTMHFRLPKESETPDRYRLLMKYKHLPFTSISDSQRGNMGLTFVSTVYNGIDLNLYPFEEKPDNYFIWLGKVNPIKGTREAILAAKKAGVKLLVVGAIDHGVPEMLSYYENDVKPLIDGDQILFREEVPVSEKAHLFGHARGFLNPISWEEPFGLVMIEAQATGTPVISFNRGAAPELVKDQKTGFLVNDISEMVDAIKRIDSIGRRACRANVEKHFSADIMTKGYVNVYEMVCANWNQYISVQKNSI